MREEISFYSKDWGLNYEITDECCWYDVFKGFVHGMNIPKHLITEALDRAFSEAVVYPTNYKVPEELLIEFSYNGVNYKFIISNMEGINRVPLSKKGEDILEGYTEDDFIPYEILKKYVKAKDLKWVDILFCNKNAYEKGMEKFNEEGYTKASMYYNIGFFDAAWDLHLLADCSLVENEENIAYGKIIRWKKEEDPLEDDK